MSNTLLLPIERVPKKKATIKATTIKPTGLVTTEKEAQVAAIFCNVCWKWCRICPTEGTCPK